MDENRIVELLTRKIAGEASAEELGELSYLLSKYPDSVYYEALLEQVWELGTDKLDTNQSRTFKDHKLKFKEDLKFKKPIGKIEVFARRPAFFVIAFAFIFGAAVFVIRRHIEPINQNRVEIVAKKGVRKKIKLPDGTLVSLNSDSKISYDPEMLSRETREVSLSGEAFFDVAYDNEHTFIANTNKIAVEAFETEFNIREYPGEMQSVTTLLKGSIEITLKDRSEQKFLLQSSEKFTLFEKRSESSKSENKSVLSIEHISPLILGGEEYIEEISWVDDKLVFQNEAFEDLIPKFERWYNVDIDLNDPKIKSLRFTAILTNENVVEALEMMKLVKPFSYKLMENKVKIY